MAEKKVSIEMQDLEIPSKRLTVQNKEQIKDLEHIQEMSFLNLPDGSYKVTPKPGGKFDLKAEPKSQIVRCQGSKSYSVQFEIKGIIEG